MKKIVAGMLACMLILLSSIAFAEKDEPVFEIHNGVQFGMSLEEAITCEMAAGFTIRELPYLLCESPGFIATGTIVGKEDVDIYYCFNNSNKLIQAVYYFNEHIFNSIEAALIQKYGETDHSYITQKSFENFELRPKVVRSVFNKPLAADLPWSQRIIVISDSLTIAINHFDNTPSGDAIVYSAIFLGDTAEISENDLNDL